MKSHKHAEILRDIADGKEVQFLSNGSWYDYVMDEMHSPLNNDGVNFK